MAGTATTKASSSNPKAAVPILLFSFVFCLVIDNGFKFMSQPIADDLGLSITTVSLQATLAGIVIGIGAVVYAAMADAINIRTLMLIGVAFIAVGSLLGFVFSGSWPMVLTGRLIQTSGLAAAETLYVIYVTKYLSRDDQKTYLGFSTSAFQLALLIGTLTSGYVATYISWTAMFLIPLLMLFTVPFILKQIPEQQATQSNLDVLGLLLITVIATSVMLYMQEFQWLYLIPIVLGIAFFIWHININPKALVKPAFFKNGRYVWAITLVLIIYSVQLGYILFLFPYAMRDLQGLTLDQASLMIAPGYACAVIVGALSGKIGQYLSSRATIFTALIGITGSLAVSAVTLESGRVPLIIAAVVFASAFALMYAPLVSTAIQNIPAEQSGVAIGFYNLTINIAIPVGIAYTAKLIDMKLNLFGALTSASTETGVNYASVLWIITLIALSGTVIYFLADRAMLASERRAKAHA
ncbi:MFS transporter [Corynebacterium sp.]|uniref:MFS transporter n=1 Tax=Corynebacterium sp. TaxID=1720 RepID=UPI0026DD5A45|nr:MFS transporter [Corynebacterium sp.]MDO5077320.1 MFS transporter [Corynebacterium sp.]